MELRERIIEWWLKGDFEDRSEGTGIGFLTRTPYGWEFDSIVDPFINVILPEIDTQRLDTILHLDALSGDSSLLVVRDGPTGLSFHVVCV